MTSPIEDITVQCPKCGHLYQDWFRGSVNLDLDDFDEEYLDRLRSRGIDLEGLQRDESGPTFFWKGQYHENFNRRDTLDIQLNVFEKFRPDLPDGYKSAPYVLLGNIHPALQAHVLDQLEGEGAYVLADTIDLWINIERENLLSLIKRVNLFVINDSEAEELTALAAT